MNSVLCTVHIRIPDIPPSYNNLYKINYQHRTVYLSPEARNFKRLVKMVTPPFEVGKDTRIGLQIDIYTNWFYKNGNLKKSDVQNMDKALIDAITEKLGFDDSRIFKLELNKVQENEEIKYRTEVTLTILGAYGEH